MRGIIVFIIAFTFGVLGIVDYYIWKPFEEKVITVSPTPTPQTGLDRVALVNNPPSESITGEITTLNGTVMWEARGVTEPVEITEPQQIQQGEILETDKGSKVAIMFTKDISVSMKEESKVEFIQTLQNKMVLMQDAGNVEYTNTTESPLSVRSSAMIILLKNGSMNISYDEKKQTITVDIQRGTATIAYNNADYVSQVIPLKGGNTFLFDIEERDGEIL